MVPSEADCTLIVAYMIYYFMQQYLLATEGDSHSAALFDDRLNWDRIV
jgi:hypothetical protein